MTPKSPDRKNESTTNIGRLSELVETSVTARLRLAFLVPLAAAVAALFIIGLVAMHLHERDMINGDVTRAQTLVEKLYHDDVDHNAQSLNVAMEVVGHSTALRAALARRDRAALLQLSAPLFAKLSRKFGITHFYFSGPDRVNILRVHQPARYGDVIKRYTTLEAERTGATFYGVELGPLGTFTLRLVAPWYTADAQHRLIGYVELGMEIDHILDTVQKFTGVPMFVLVSKQYLKRDNWEAGMRMLGRQPDWNRFPNAVLSTQGVQAMPASLATRLVNGLPAVASVMDVTQAGASYRAVFLPLIDASGHDVGRMVALVDVSKHFGTSRRMLYLGDGIGALICILLLVFFYWLVGRVGRRIEQRERELETRNSQLDTLNQVAVAITSSLDLQNRLDEIMKHGISLTGAGASCVAFYDEATGRFKEWITHGLSQHFVNNMSFQSGGLADKAFNTANYILSNDRPETMYKLSNLAREEGLRCLICLPLTGHDQCLGVIYFYRADRDTFMPAEIELLTIFASLVAQAIENARLYEQMQEQARTDALTGLKNRRTFDTLLVDEIARALRFKRPVSLLMLDIDHFKRVNDTYGHQAGDAVLKGLGELLGRQARAIDRVCRYGGEEFTVILPETDFENAAKAAERLRAAVEAHRFDVNIDEPLRIAVSIGVASFPAHADSAQALVAAADSAMYVAKQNGRNRINCYTSVSGQTVIQE
jgi:diguanylate cyclase (GGDEF)-like protein